MKMRDLSTSQYHAPFVIILWDVNQLADSDTMWAREKLKDNGIPMLVLSESIPELQSDDYYIPGDGHPNEMAYMLVARALNGYLHQKFPSISHISIAWP
jgi:hypothetical protein